MLNRYGRCPAGNRPKYRSGHLMPRLLWCTLLLLHGAVVQATLPPKIIPGKELIVVPRERSAADSGEHVSEVDRLLESEPLPPYHVHPNYYSRDLQYQWSRLPRGRAVVVARHPATGERECMDIVLPNGAPIVIYRRDSITYLYERPERGADERVIVQFCLLGKLPTRVHYRRGQGTFRTLQNKATGLRQRARTLAARIPVVGSVRENARKVKDTAKGAAVVGGQAAKAYSDTVGKLLDGLPVLSTLKDLGERAPELGRLEEVRRAGDRAARDAGESVRTIR